MGEAVVFKKVLIANRGEIACRIAATLREMGIGAVGVYSDADRDALHTRSVDEAVRIGAAEARASYLDIGSIIDAAKQSGAEAVHPGYGFLAENADFAEAVEEAGLVFIGPTPEQLRALGDKRASRSLAEKAGVPLVPGAEASDLDGLVAASAKLGYPLIVKAALGGGGKGMQAVQDEASLREALESSQRVAASAFGDSAVYLEKRIERARHVEVQVLGDGKGNVVHFFERECSLQRRHQKVVEECPATIEEWLRERLLAAAVNLTSEARYRGAGTVEFLVAGDDFYFLEVNARLQVEHPVTELVTGHDLVRGQLMVAANGKLPLAQSDVPRNGCAIEVRVYAEDAAANFLPQAGEASAVRWPRRPFVRVDAGVESGDHVPVHYDPILAKIVAWGAGRERALGRLAGAVDETLVHGVITNLPFLRALLRAPQVKGAAIDVEWIEREFLEGFAALANAPAPELVLAAASLAEALDPAGSGTARGRDRVRVADAFRAAGRWRLPGLDGS